MAKSLENSDMPRKRSNASGCEGPLPHSYCLMWQEGRLTNSALQSGLEFGDAVAVPAADYGHNADVLLVGRQGTYLVQWKVFVPGGTAVHTRLALQACGVDLPGGELSVAHGAKDGDTLYAAQSVVSLLAGAALRLSSSQVIAYSAANPADMVASMLVMRLD